MTTIKRNVPETTKKIGTSQLNHSKETLWADRLIMKLKIYHLPHYL